MATDRGQMLGRMMLNYVLPGRPVLVRLMAGSTQRGVGVSYYHTALFTPATNTIHADIEPVEIEVGTGDNIDRIIAVDLQSGRTLVDENYALTISNPTIVTVEELQVQLKSFND